MGKNVNGQKQIEGHVASEEHNCQELGSEYGEESMPTRMEEKERIHACVRTRQNPVELAFMGDLVLGNRVILVAVQQQQNLHGLRSAHQKVWV